MEQAYVDEHCSQCVYALSQNGGYKCLRARRYDCLDVECPIYDSVAMPKVESKPVPVKPEPVAAVPDPEPVSQGVDPEEKPLTRKLAFKILPVKKGAHKAVIIKTQETLEAGTVPAPKPDESVKPEPAQEKLEAPAAEKVELKQPCCRTAADCPSYAQEALENAIKQDKKTADIIHHPAHYTWRGRECVEHLRDWLGHDGYLAYLEGNVQKYLYRWQKKNGIEDLDKAIEYIELIKKEAGNEAAK
jgi:hypothetical protein